MDKTARLKLIIVAILIQFPFFAVALVSSVDANDFTKLIPIPNSQFDVIFLFLISPLIMMAFIHFFSILLGYFLFKLHNFIKIKRYDYTIFKTDMLNLTLRETFLRSLLLGFFAFSMGLIITEFFKPSIIIVNDPETTQYGFFVVISTLFILPFLILILLPIWVLKDASIVCSRKKYKEGILKIPDIEGAYRTYNSYILGYIGISTVIAVIFLIYKDIIFNIKGAGEVGFIPLTIITPFVGIGVNLIPLIFYELRSQKIREKIINKLMAEEIRIVDNINDI